MKVLDLSQTSKYKVTSEINHHCGGKSISKIWLASFEKGLGGFAFTDKHEDGFEEKFMSSIAFYNQGIGVYCRNTRKNYLILIPASMIEELEIFKDTDTISPLKFSFYSFLKKMGSSDHTASKYLMPKEIIKEHPPMFHIRTSDKIIHLQIEKINPERLISLIKNTNFADITSVNLFPPIII